MIESKWETLAARLELPPDAFGDWTATDGMLYAASQAADAREELAALERAARALAGLRDKLPHVIDPLKIEIAARHHRLAAFPRKGPMRVDAYFVADKVARAFVAAGRAVTYGQAPDGTTPSTPYCRAVMIAFEVLEIAGSWRDPAKAAWKKYRD